MSRSHVFRGRWCVVIILSERELGMGSKDWLPVRAETCWHSPSRPRPRALTSGRGTAGAGLLAFSLWLHGGSLLPGGSAWPLCWCSQQSWHAVNNPGRHSVYHTVWLLVGPKGSSRHFPVMRFVLLWHSDLIHSSQGSRADYSSKFCFIHLPAGLSRLVQWCAVFQTALCIFQLCFAFQH